jgi:plasmid maintenance system antidote protein VapI
VSDLVNDRRVVTAPLALVLGTPPQYWMDLQRAMAADSATGALKG